MKSINKALENFNKLKEEMVEAQKKLNQETQKYPHVKIKAVTYPEDFREIGRIYDVRILGYDAYTEEMMVETTKGDIFPVKNVEFLTEAQAEKIRGKNNVVNLADYRRRKLAA